MEETLWNTARDTEMTTIARTVDLPRLNLVKGLVLDTGRKVRIHISRRETLFLWTIPTYPPSMEKLRGTPHSEPLTDTWTSDFVTDFLSREGEGREVIGERLRDKSVT